ncbi:cell wall hydrolase [Neobacillus sp. FSL H8-0543]|uniref:cell wall hydrolase n=1 Tax=Neobacillus sp. FSL H8-0543 TaxID=2954672 RepID=UPI003158F356
MKNTMKTFVVACVATFSFIGLQNHTAKAITEISKMQNTSETTKIAVPFLESEIETPEKAAEETASKESGAPSSEPEIETSEKAAEETTSKESGAPSSEPEIETAEKILEETAVSLSNQEKDLFARIVEAEAKGESYEGKVAVATVVLNRVESPHFPNTVTDVINEVVGDAYAFTPVQNGEIKKPASDEAIQAVDEALTRKDRLNNSIYFYNPDIATDDWITTRQVVTKIGNHVFAK